MQSRRFCAFVMVAALAVGGAACSKKSTTETSAATTTAAPSVTAGKVNSGSAAGRCPTQEEVDSLDQQMTALFDNPSLSSNLSADAQKALEIEGKYIPDSLSADWATISNATAQAASAMGSLNTTDTSPGNMAALQAAVAPMTTPEVTAAEQNIIQYFTTTCPNIKFSATTSSSSSGTSGGGSGGTTTTY